MSPRITNLQMSSQFLRDLQRTQSNMERAQREITTGKRINSPSDDPFGTSRVLSLDSQVADIAQFRRNATDALGIVNAADSALGDVTETLKRVRELMLQASNSTNDQAALNSIAQEVSQLKQALRDQANTRYGNSFLFAGTATDTQPYPANFYAGNTGTINRRVSAGVEMQVNVAGPDVFGTTTGPNPADLGLFDLMDRVVANMTSGNPADREELRGDALRAVDARIEDVLQHRANLGATASRLESTQERLSELALRVEETRAELANVDMAKAYMDFQTQSSMYESALAAGARMMRTSLLDFI